MFLRNHKSNYFVHLSLSVSDLSEALFVQFVCKLNARFGSDQD